MKEPKIIPSDYFQKDKNQEYLQWLIDNHYPEPEKYEILESKINQ